jgi:hypothetical protein
VECEDDRLVLGEKRIEVRIAQAVWMLAAPLQLHEIDNVDHPAIAHRGLCGVVRS